MIKNIKIKENFKKDWCFVIIIGMFTKKIFLEERKMTQDEEQPADQPSEGGGDAPSEGGGDAPSEGSGDEEKTE